jgi:hypothetical protein
MQEAVAAKGVAGAIPVCKEEAPALIKEKRKETGWDIRRVSCQSASNSFQLSASKSFQFVRQI